MRFSHLGKDCNGYNSRQVAVSSHKVLLNDARRFYQSCLYLGDHLNIMKLLKLQSRFHKTKPSHYHNLHELTWRDSYASCSGLSNQTNKKVFNCTGARCTCHWSSSECEYEALLSARWQLTDLSPDALCKTPWTLFSTESYKLWSILLFSFRTN